MIHSDRDWLLDALHHLAMLKDHLAIVDVDSQVAVDAAALRLSSAIESVSHVSDELRRRVISDELWRKIKGTRNRIVHEYTFLEPPLLRAIFESDTATLEADIRRLLEQAPA